MFVSCVYVPEVFCPKLRERWPYTVPGIAEVVERGLEFTRPVTLLDGGDHPELAEPLMRHANALLSP